MKESLHIFAKDARRFWPEILVSLIITAAFAWIYPFNWAPMDYSQQLRVILSNTITVLVPVGWAILITRVVHDESLVGDRQFWITRPYQWPQLLTAKALFLIAFLYFPILLAQCVLLHVAGFAVFSHALGLFFNLILLTGILVLPLFALAAVTSTFAKMAVTLLGVLLAFVSGLLVVSSFKTGVTLPDEGYLSSVLFVSSVIAIIVLQYARRRTLLSRLLLIGVVVIPVVIGMALPRSRSVMHAYPRAASSDRSPVQLAVDSGREAFASPIPNQKDIILNVPLIASGVAPGTAVRIDNVTATIEAPNGLHQTSPWRSTFAENYLPGTQQSFAYITVGRSFYESVKSLPLTMHITFSVTRLQAGTTTTVPLTYGDISVPGFGICSFSGLSPNSLSCRFPMRQPRLSMVSSVLSKAPCSQVQYGADTISAMAWTGNLDKDPAQFGITSVWDQGIFLANRETQLLKPDFYQNHRLCPGSPLTVTQYNATGRTQADLAVTGLKVVERPYGSLALSAGSL